MPEMVGKLDVAGRFSCRIALESKQKNVWIKKKLDPSGYELGRSALRETLALVHEFSISQMARRVQNQF
jgi:hypothetical protein